MAVAAKPKERRIWSGRRRRRVVLVSSLFHCSLCDSYFDERLDYDEHRFRCERHNGED